MGCRDNKPGAASLCSMLEGSGLKKKKKHFSNVYLKMDRAGTPSTTMFMGPSLQCVETTGRDNVRMSLLSQPWGWTTAGRRGCLSGSRAPISLNESELP